MTANIWWKVIKRDFYLQKHRGADASSVFIFFIGICSLFPLVLGQESSQLATIGGAVIWISALVSVILSLDPMLRSDYEQGILEQWQLSPYSLSHFLLLRALSHYIYLGLPCYFYQEYLDYYFIYLDLVFMLLY